MSVENRLMSKDEMMKSVSFTDNNGLIDLKAFFKTRFNYSEREFKHECLYITHHLFNSKFNSVVEDGNPTLVFGHIDLSKLLEKLSSNTIGIENILGLVRHLEIEGTSLEKVIDFDGKHFMYNSFSYSSMDGDDVLYEINFLEDLELFSVNGKDFHSAKIVNEYKNKDGNIVIEFASAFYGHLFDVVIVNVTAKDWFESLRGF
jgi:hypothetical protein